MYEYAHSKQPPEGLSLPKGLAEVIPGPDRIIIESFSNAGVTFGERYRVGMNDCEMAQDFIQYRVKRIRGVSYAEERKYYIGLFADAIHPFFRRYTNDIAGCAENIVGNSSELPSLYEITDGTLNVELDSGYRHAGYQETSEYFRYNAMYHESYHDGGGSGFREWYVYAASITECKAELSDEIGYKDFRALPGFISLPYCRGFWTEGGHVYLIDPWGVSGIFEYYCYAEEQRDYDSDKKIWNVGVPYKKQA